MTTLLTEHVRHFGAQTDPSGEVLGEVYRLLRRQMRARGLLNWSPGLLGYPDVRRWQDEGAFDDIVSDCYIEAIARRIPTLQNQLGSTDSIDALIVHNINHFLAERQRDHNPIGYAVFQNVRAAVRQAAEEHALRLERRRGRSWSGSVLRFHGSAVSSPIATETLAEEVGRQPGLPEISHQLARVCLPAQEWVLGVLEGLRDRRLPPVRFGDLVQVLERQARDAWARAAPPAEDVVAERGADGVGQLVRVVRADTTLEEQEHGQSLLSRVRQGVEELRQQDRIRMRRLRVFDEIVRFLHEEPGRIIRQVEIAEKLGIHQVTLHRDVEVIGEVVLRVVRGNN